MGPQYPVSLNLTPRAWRALLYLCNLTEEVDPERVMVDALIAEARARGWEDPEGAGQWQD